MPLLEGRQHSLDSILNPEDTALRSLDNLHLEFPYPNTSNPSYPVKKVFSSPWLPEVEFCIGLDMQRLEPKLCY